MFLVRASGDGSEPNAYTVTFWTDGKVHHYRVKSQGGKFMVRGQGYDTLVDLIEAHRTQVLYADVGYSAILDTFY